MTNSLKRLFGIGLFDVVAYVDTRVMLYGFILYHWMVFGTDMYGPKVDIAKCQPFIITYGNF